MNWFLTLRYGKEKQVYGKVLREPRRKPRPQRPNHQTTIQQLVQGYARLSYRTLASELRSIVVWCKICNAFSLVR